jgi:hypothetical protein
MGDCIVDTCVLKSASDREAHEAVACLSTLLAIEAASHAVICSYSLWEEWQKHLSKSAAIWQSHMLSRQLILFYEPSRHHKAEIDRWMMCLEHDKQKIARKDEHLISLAVSSNSLVISSEIACRDIFIELGRMYPPVSAVYWVSPLTCPGLVAWLGTPNAVPIDWQLVRSISR